MKALSSDWGKRKPPALEGAVHPAVELIVPESIPYRGGVRRGRERIENGLRRISDALGRVLLNAP